MTNQYLWTPWRMQYITGAKDGGESEARARSDAQEASPSSAADEADLPQMGSLGAEQAFSPEQNKPPALERSEGERERCVFCARARMPSEHDRANLVLLRGERNFVILNLYPYNSAHMMVVPYLHTADFASLDAQTVGEMTALLQKMLRVVSEEYKPEGFNVGMNLGRIAGAGVADHVHMHLVPRWAGDTNFMPVVGATKVMPELLETTYDRLKARLTPASGS